MIAILLAAAAAAESPRPAPALHQGEARSVMEAQLAVPPRTDADAGLDPDEADMILKRYLASVGQTLAPAPGEDP